MPSLWPMNHISPSMPDQLSPAIATTPPPSPDFKYRRIRQVLFALLFMVVGWHLWIFSQLLEMRGSNPEMSAFMQQALENNPKDRLKQQWVNYSRISSHLKRAVIAAEDAAFVNHSGFDWQGIQLALEKNMEQGRIAAGGSTISQQLAKNLFLSGERSFIRKAEETLITIMMETTLSKQRILELYLNYAEWGNGIYGAEAAARHHYGVSAARITSWQAARLASILPNPRYYDGNRTDWMYEKTDIILNRMPKVRIPR